MGPTCGLPGADRTQVGPIWDTWTLLSGVPAIDHQHNCQHCGSIDFQLRSFDIHLLINNKKHPRKQTSATPSLKRVKHSTQAWNSVAYWFLCPYPISRMFIHPTNTDPENKNGPYAQGVKPIIPKVVPCVIANISWKFHENPLIGFTVVLLTNTPGAPRWETVKQSRQVWKSLANYFLCRAWHFIKNWWKSVHPFFHNITNKHGSIE